MSRLSSKGTISAAGLTVLLGMMPSTAWAQSEEVQASSGDDNVIIVTAQRRAERLVDVPITVTTIGEDELSAANVQELGDIAKVTPSLRFDSSAAFAQPTIRGIGTAVVTSGGGANVGIYMDGFYSPNPLAANSQLLNVQSIQVLKGPQGTLFGRNTTGGAILIDTAKPSDEPAAKFKASYGRFDQVVAQGYATYGLAEGFAVDIEAMYRRGDGFKTNIIDGNNKVGQYESWSVRAGINMEITDDLSVLFRYQHGDVDDTNPVNANTYVDPVLGAGAPNFVPPAFYTSDPNQVAQDRPTLFTSNSDSVQITVSADIGFADFKSYSQYRTEDVDISTALDFVGAPIFQIGIPVDNETFSQEFLFNSKPGGPLQWTAGLFFFSNRDTYQTYIDTGGIFRADNGPTRLGGSSTTTKSYAAFLDATYELTPQLFITAGARYAHDVVTDAYYNNPANPVGEIALPSISADKVTPRFVIRYKPTEESSIYASFAKGYKAGVIDVGGSCQNAPAFLCNDIQPEDVNAFEIGGKYDDRRFSMEAAAFYYDYKNLQISSFLGTGQATIANAATSEIYGLEAAFRYEISDQFQINAGGAWTHARYKRFDNAPIYVRCPGVAGCGFGTSFFVPVGNNLTNTTMQRTPEFTGNFGALYHTELGGGQFKLSGNLFYTSKFFFGPSGVQFPQKGYEVLTARAQWTDPSDTFTLALWGDNLTGSRYRTAVEYNSFGLGAKWSAPTTYGIEVGAKF